MTVRPSRRPGIIPALPRPVWAVLGGDFVSAIGAGLTLPCLFIYAHQVRHLGYGTAGLVVSTIALASLAGNPLGGAAADRWTPRRALMAGLVIAAAGSVALALARSEPALFAAAALSGLGVSIIWPVQDALLASLTEPRSRSAVFSVGHTCLNAGLSVGALGTAAIVSVAHPGTFSAVFVADGCTYLVPVLVLARLRLPAAQDCAHDDTAHDETAQGDSVQQDAQASPAQRGYLAVLRDRTFLRVWVLIALIVTVTFGQYQSSFAGFTTRPGGIGTHGLALAYAANTVTVVIAQLFVLRWLTGRRRTTGAALAGVAWAVSWLVVFAGGHLGGGLAAEGTFAAAMAIFAIGETLLSPTLPAIVNDLAPPGAEGRYNGLGVLGFTAGFLLGPAAGGAALAAGWGGRLFAVIAAVCLAASIGALRLGRHLPAAVNRVSAADEPDPDSASASERVELAR